MSSPERNRTTPLKKKNRHTHTASLPEFWFTKDPKSHPLKNAVLKMRLHALSNSASASETEPESESDSQARPPQRLSSAARSCPDFTARLSDELLMNIFSKLQNSQLVSNTLVCKRWCRLNGKLVRSVKILDWDFIESGRVIFRFPNLIDVDIVQACVKSCRNSGILLSNKLVSVHLDSARVSGRGFLKKGDFLDPQVIDRGVRALAEGCGNLRRVVLINVSEEGLNYVAEECETLQEMELHNCDDFALKGVSGCKNLQILRLIGCVDGFYESLISDIGLTILAQGCRRLVKLELVGCEGSYDGIKAIGQCCFMLEELTLCDHRMEGGWLAALSYCGNLKTLKLQSFKSIDASPGPDEHLGSCPTLEELHLKKGQLRDKQGARALFLVCQAVRELVFEDCWGLDDSTFAATSICRSIRFLSLEGCSLLTTEGLESIILSWKHLTRLRVVSCNNIKDSDITPELATLFSVLKELKWRPDSLSLLASGLAGTGVGRNGGRSFRL
ncbi:F-box protein At5g51370-like [Coffea eugenioides]|uniref:F-box protein At5g51370-like n=1 Tax=Coffea eugenioides TaxID=49369 RepID=UPI000F60B101|nr:F-box protein At5g51370-like [Coffea eugenioides]